VTNRVRLVATKRRSLPLQGNDVYVFYAHSLRHDKGVYRYLQVTHLLTYSFQPCLWFQRVCHLLRFGLNSMKIITVTKQSGFIHLRAFNFKSGKFYIHLCTVCSLCGIRFPSILSV